MAKTEDLRRVIVSVLSEVCPRVYYENAHDEAAALSKISEDDYEGGADDG